MSSDAEVGNDIPSTAVNIDFYHWGGNFAMLFLGRSNKHVAIMEKYFKITNTLHDKVISKKYCG